MLTCYKEENKIEIRKNLSTLLQNLTEQSDCTTWVIVEPLRDDIIKSFVNIYEEEGYTLFKEVKEDIEEKGAYAFCLNELPEMKEWITENYGKNWFSFFVSSASKEEILDHFSSLSYLKTQDKSYLFRYYDPVTFNCWVSGLNALERTADALGLFTDIYVESPLPEVLMHYTVSEKHIENKKIFLDKELKEELAVLANSTVIHTTLDGCWYMTQKEYEYLTPVALNTFKIKLCKNLLKEYSLLNEYTLTEVYTVINTEVARATTYGIVKKYLLAQFVNIYFKNPEFWKEYAENIERIISNSNTSSVDKMEIILESLYNLKKRENAHS